MADAEIGFQERLRLRIEDLIAHVMQADEARIITAVAFASEQGLLDDPTAELLLIARRMLLATTVSLSAGIELHRLKIPTSGAPPTCPSCGTEGRCRTLRRTADTLALYLPEPVTLSRSEAWRRADALLNPSDADNLIGIREIPDAYVAWAVPGHHHLQEQATTEGTVIIVDKRTGLLTKWPALPIATLAEHYHRYAMGQPLTPPSQGGV